MHQVCLSLLILAIFTCGTSPAPGHSDLHASGKLYFLLHQNLLFSNSRQVQLVHFSSRLKKPSDGVLTLHFHAFTLCPPHLLSIRSQKCQGARTAAISPLGQNLPLSAFHLDNFFFFMAHSQADHCGNLPWAHVAHKPEDFSHNPWIRHNNLHLTTAYNLGRSWRFDNTSPNRASFVICAL